MRPGVGPNAIPWGGSLQETVKLNTYVYADDDPVNLVDPTGRDCFYDALGASITGLGVARGIQSLLSFGVAQLAGGAGIALSALGELGMPLRMLCNGYPSPKRAS